MKNAWLFLLMFTACIPGVDDVPELGEVEFQEGEQTWTEESKKIGWVTKDRELYVLNKDLSYLHNFERGRIHLENTQTGERGWIAKRREVFRNPAEAEVSYPAADSIASGRWAFTEITPYRMKDGDIHLDHRILNIFWHIPAIPAFYIKGQYYVKSVRYSDMAPFLADKAAIDRGVRENRIVLEATSPYIWDDVEGVSIELDNAFKLWDFSDILKMPENYIK